MRVILKALFSAVPNVRDLQKTLFSVVPVRWSSN